MNHNSNKLVTCCFNLSIIRLKMYILTLKSSIIFTFMNLQIWGVVSWFKLELILLCLLVFFSMERQCEILKLTVVQRFFMKYHVPLELPRLHDYAICIQSILIHFCCSWNLHTRRFENKRMCSNRTLNTATTIRLLVLHLSWWKKENGSVLLQIPEESFPESRLGFNTLNWILKL